MTMSAKLPEDPGIDLQNQEQALRPGSPSSCLHPVLALDHSVGDNDDHESQTSGSLPLAPSSPPTDSDGDGYVRDKPDRGERDYTQTAKSTRRTRSPTSDSTRCLRQVLQSVDSIRRGRHSALTEHRDCLEFPLPPAGYNRFRQFLEGGPSALAQVEAGLDLDLEPLWHWATDHLIWDYDAHLSLLMVRANTPLHQLTSQEVELLLKDRFRIALETSGRRGRIKTLPNIGQIFREPQTGRTPPSQQTRRLPQRRVSTKSQRGHRDENADAPVMSTGSGAQVESTPGPSSPGTGKEDVRSPDIGLLYCPHDSPEDYYPGVIVEVGYSHPVNDSVAKRLIRYSNGTVRFVLAFNIEYDPAHRGRKITMTAYRLVITEDEWYPEKYLEDYDVRERAKTLVKDEQDPVDVDIGLRLSHLHERLLPREGDDDVPITLPLRELINIVDTALSRQSLHDAVSSGSAAGPTPQSLRGKRARTETPPTGGDDEATLLRDPGAGYIPPRASSIKKRRTEKARE